MSDSETTKSPGRDALGILLFGLAVFGAISVLMAMFQPVENATGTTAVVGGYVGLVGKLPGLAISIGLAWLGGRLWLLGKSEGVARDLAGIVGASLGLAVLAGAAVEGAGGSLGAVTGGTVSSFLTPFVGVPFGLGCLLVPIWFAWIRPNDLISWKVGKKEDQAAAGDTESEGVSVAEAEALMPRIPPREPVAPEEPAPLPPLYPHDVRLEGKIPEGTRPLNAPDAPASAPAPYVEDAAVSERAAEAVRRAADPVGQDLVAEAHAADVTPLEAQPLRAEPQAFEAPVGAAPQPYGEPAPEVTPLDADAEPPRSAPRASTTSAASEVTPLHSAAIPAPSWEQPSLYGEEPVDAYGTPESLTTSPTSEELADEEPPEEESAAQPGSTERALADTLAVEDTAEDVEAEEDEDEDAHAEGEEYEDDEEEEEEDEDEEVHAEADEEEEDDEAEEEDEEEDEDAHAEGDEEEDDEEYEEDEEEEEDAEYEEVHAEADEEEEDDEAEEEDEEEDEDARAEDEEYEDDEEEEAEEPEEVAAEEQEAPVEAAAEETEPEVELQPAPPPTPVPAAEATEDTSVEVDVTELSGAEVLQRAGDLFLARGRVAVSMLQREFGLDFKQATLILDQLQEVGLIGPYIGGKRRDILMTAEEWRERVGAL